MFINLARTKFGKNIPYQQPVMEKRLKSVVVGSGLQEKIDETGRHITQFSARHYAATNALMIGIDIYDLAVNLGTSVHYIKRTYSPITAMMKSQELTKGQGYWKAIEERGNLTEQDLMESGDLPNIRGRSRGIAKEELRKAGALPDYDGNYTKTGQ